PIAESAPIAEPSPVAEPVEAPWLETHPSTGSGNADDSGAAPVFMSRREARAAEAAVAGVQAEPVSHAASEPSHTSAPQPLPPVAVAAAAPQVPTIDWDTAPPVLAH